MPGNLVFGTPACEQVENAVLLRFYSLITGIGQYNRRKIANTNTWSQHSWANAPDIHVQSLADGDIIYAWLVQNKAALGIRNILWRVTNHYDHLHVDVWPKGVGTPPYSLTGSGYFRYSDGRQVFTALKSVTPEKIWTETEGEDQVLDTNSPKPSSAVAMFQRDLIHLGYNLGDAPSIQPGLYPVGADGKYGEATVNGCKAFQGDMEIAVTGKGDALTVTLAANLARFNQVKAVPTSTVDSTARTAASAAQATANSAHTRLDKLKSI